MKGTTASSPASVVLQPGDKLLSINGVNVEAWGRLRVQDVRTTVPPRVTLLVAWFAVCVRVR